MSDDWYLKAGHVIGLLVGAICFVGSWIYCTAEYGYLLGFSLGWFPSAISAFLAYWVTRFLWGPAFCAVAGIWLLQGFNPSL